MKQEKTDKAAFKEKMRELKLDKKLQETIEQNIQVPLSACAKNQKQIDAEEKSSAVANEFLLKDVGLLPDEKLSFTKAITGALDGEKKSIFPDGTVIHFLLALLWKLGNNQADVKPYLDSLAQGLAIPAHDLFVWQDAPTYDLNYYTILKSKSEQEIMAMNLADLIFACYGYDYYENILPPTVSMIGHAHYLNLNNNEIIEFPDCGETSLRNFINFLIYDSDNHVFTTELLEKLSENPSPALIAFYKKYKTPELILKDQAHNAWAQVVSNLPGVQYRNGTCNISSDTGMKNMLAVINNLLPGVNTWEILEKRISSLGFYISIMPEKPFGEQPIHNTLTMVLAKPNKRPVKLMWHFVPGHFVIAFPSMSQLEHAELYRNALEKKIAAIPSANASQRWPFIMLLAASAGNAPLAFASASSLSYPAILLPPTVTLENHIHVATRAILALNLEQNPTVQKCVGAVMQNVYKKLPKDEGLINQFFQAMLAQVIPNNLESYNAYKTLFENAKQHFVSIVDNHSKIFMLHAMLNAKDPENKKAQELFEQIISYAIKSSYLLTDESGIIAKDFAAMLRKAEQKSQQLIKLIVNAAVNLLTSLQTDDGKTSSVGWLLEVPIPSDPEMQELIKPLFQAIAESLPTKKEDSLIDIISWISIMEIPSNKNAQEIIKPIFDEAPKLLYRITVDSKKRSAIRCISNMNPKHFITTEHVTLIKPLFDAAAKLFISIKDPVQKEGLVAWIENMIIRPYYAPEAKNLINSLREAAGMRPLA